MALYHPEHITIRGNISPQREHYLRSTIVDVPYHMVVKSNLGGTWSHCIEPKWPNTRLSHHFMLKIWSQGDRPEFSSMDGTGYINGVGNLLQV